MSSKNNSYLSDVNFFYAHAGLFSFAEIIFLFSLPILFWNQGFSLSFIFGFFAFMALPGYLFTKHVVRYILKTSVKSALIFGVISYVFLGLILPLVAIDNLWWIAVFCIGAVQSLFYFPARHLYFTEIISQKTIGVQSGVLNAVMIVARTIAPIVAGLIALLTKFNWIFILGAAVFLLSVVPVFAISTKFSKKFNNVRFKEMVEEHPVFQTTKSAYVADGLNGFLSYVLWPLLFFLFISQNDFFELGSLMTVTYAVSALIMVVVGHFFDKQHRKKLLRLSVFSNVLAALGRFSLMFFHPMIFVYAVQSFYSFSESALQSTFEAYWYSYSKKTNVVFYTIHREQNYSLGRFLGGLILAVFAFFLTDVQSLWPFFLLSIPGLFFYLKKQDVDYHLDQ